MQEKRNETMHLFIFLNYYNVIPFNTAVRIRPMMKCVEYLCDDLGVCLQAHSVLDMTIIYLDV